MNKYSYNHPFHLVTPSPWPLTTSLRIFIIILGLIKWFHKFNIIIFIIGIITLIFNLSIWWRDITRERTYQGIHTKNVSKLLRIGILLFIVSELFFFLSFFWAFFHRALSPNIEIGINWPPINIKPFNPYNIPLLNTIILLRSGITITWSHYRILNNNLIERIKSLKITIILGIYFTFLQYFEYRESSFTISDSIYGSTFFITTGFHGIHVIIGTIFIIITTIRIINFHFSKTHHFGFEARAWYWHFVDIIWLFVYIFIYYWKF